MKLGAQYSGHSHDVAGGRGELEVLVDAAQSAISRYTGAASALYAKASEHLARVEKYGRPTGYARIESDLQRHCIPVAGLYREAADGYQELVNIHEQAMYMSGRENSGSAVLSPSQHPNGKGVKE